MRASGCLVWPDSENDKDAPLSHPPGAVAYPPDGQVHPGMLRLAGRVQSARLAAVAARPAARGAAGVGLQLFAPAAGARTAAWARVSPACVQGARGYAADPEQKPTPKEQALAVQNSLTVVEKAEWEKKWKDFKESAYQSKIFERVASAGERVDDFIEDSDNFFVRQIRRAKHAFFTETEEVSSAPTHGGRSCGSAPCLHVGPARAGSIASAVPLPPRPA
jgi:hypothetical protein